MNAMSREMMEQMIGIRMAALAKKEGHESKFPNMDDRRAEKCREERKENNRYVGLATKNNSITLQAIADGHVTVSDIAKAVGLGDETVRKACRRLFEAGKIERDGILYRSGGQAFVYKIVEKE
jgi:hypothetical protein